MSSGNCINIYFGIISTDTTEYNRPATQEEASAFIGELGWHNAQLDDIDRGGYLIDLTDDAVEELEREGEIIRYSANLKLEVMIYLD